MILCLFLTVQAYLTPGQIILRSLVCTHRYVELSFSHFTVVQSVNKFTSNIVGQVIGKSGMTSILKFHTS